MQLNILSLRNFPGKTKLFPLNETLPDLTGDGAKVSFTKPLIGDLTVTNHERYYLVEGNLTTEVTVPCNRCLELFSLPLEINFSEKYYPDYAFSKEEAVEGEEYNKFSGDTIDVTEQVINAVWLALPMVAVCQPECRGLCPRCGCNLNHESCDCAQESSDPRLEVLKKLLK